MVPTLLIIGSITGLACVVILLDVLTLGPNDALDVITLGLYLAVTVTCFAGAGVIRAVRQLSGKQ